jgi:hypothetical protein
VGKMIGRQVDLDSEGIDWSDALKSNVFELPQRSFS